MKEAGRRRDHYMPLGSYRDRELPRATWSRFQVGADGPESRTLVSVSHHVTHAFNLPQPQREMEQMDLEYEVFGNYIDTFQNKTSS